MSLRRNYRRPIVRRRNSAQRSDLRRNVWRRVVWVLPLCLQWKYSGCLSVYLEFIPHSVLPTMMNLSFLEWESPSYCFPPLPMGNFWVTAALHKVAQNMMKNLRPISVFYPVLKGCLRRTPMPWRALSRKPKLPLPAFAGIICLSVFRPQSVYLLLWRDPLLQNGMTQLPYPPHLHQLHMESRSPTSHSAREISVTARPHSSTPNSNLSSSSSSFPVKRPASAMTSSENDSDQPLNLSKKVDSTIKSDPEW